MKPNQEIDSQDAESINDVISGIEDHHPELRKARVLAEIRDFLHQVEIHKDDLSA